MPTPLSPSEAEAIRAQLAQRYREFLDLWGSREEDDLEVIRKYFAESFTGFGTGKHERYADPEVTLEFLSQEREEVPQGMDIDVDWLRVKVLSDRVGVVEGEVEVTIEKWGTVVMEIPLRTTVVYQKQGDRWLMVHAQISVPADQTESETWPLEALQARNEELKRMVAARTAELEAAQARLVHAEKMASLGALTAGIAHEIKNPLNFVTNFADLSVELAEEMGHEDDPDERAALLADLRDNLARIGEHGKRADAIVAGMMAHARAGTGERQTVDVNGLVEEYAGLALHAAQAADPGLSAALRLDLNPDAGAVEAVPQELGRVVVNLVDNALDASRPGADHATSGYAPTVTVSTAGTESAVEVSVVDNGVGMGPEVAARVFEPFYTTKPTGKGTGLGLSLAHDIVAQGHGGTLTFESVAGEGTTFTVSLPRG